MTDPTLWLALASSAFYALALVLAQIGLRYRSPLAGARISLPVTAFALWLLAPLVSWPWPIAWPAVGLFAAIGVFFPVGVTLLSFESNRYLGPTLAGALGNVTPLVAVGFATLVLGERLTPLRAAGMAVVLAGVVLLTLRRRIDLRGWPLWALLLPLAAAVIRGTAQPAMKLGLGIWPAPFAATLVSYTVSASVILVIGRIAGRRAGGQAGWRGILAFAGVGLCNGGSVLLLYMALLVGRVTVVAPLVAIYPLFTLLFSAALLRSERFHARLLVGVGLTVAGVVIVLLG